MRWRNATRPLRMLRLVHGVGFARGPWRGDLAQLAASGMLTTSMPTTDGSSSRTAPARSRPAEAGTRDACPGDSWAGRSNRGPFGQLGITLRVRPRCKGWIKFVPLSIVDGRPATRDCRVVPDDAPGRSLARRSMMGWRRAATDWRQRGLPGPRPGERPPLSGYSVPSPFADAARWLLFFSLWRST